jgi:hypothetical protein
LDAEKQQQILTLGRLGWTLRRIEQETGVRREAASRSLEKAGVEVRPPGRWGHPGAKPAKEMITEAGGAGHGPFPTRDRRRLKRLARDCVCRRISKKCKDAKIMPGFSILKNCTSFYF